MTPHSSRRGAMEGSPFTTPYPVTAVPGSMPSTIMRRSLRLFQLQVAVRRDFLNVVQILELLQELHERLSRFSFDVDEVLRDGRNLRFGRKESFFVEGGAYTLHVGRIRGNDVLLTVGAEILRARLECRLESGIFTVLRGVEVDLPLSLEHPRHRVRGAEVASKPRELVPHFCDGAIGVVGKREDEDCYAARAVALVGDVDVLDALELASALLDCALDVFLRHRRGPGGFNSSAKPRVARGIAAAKLGGHRDLANELCELRSALGVGRRLVVLDLLPFTVTGHVLMSLVFS